MRCSAAESLSGRCACARLTHPSSVQVPRPAGRPVLCGLPHRRPRRLPVTQGCVGRGGGEASAGGVSADACCLRTLCPQASARPTVSPASWAAARASCEHALPSRLAHVAGARASMHIRLLGRAVEASPGRREAVGALAAAHMLYACIQPSIQQHIKGGERVHEDNSRHGPARQQHIDGPVPPFAQQGSGATYASDAADLGDDSWCWDRAHRGKGAHSKRQHHARTGGARKRAGTSPACVKGAAEPRNERL